MTKNFYGRRPSDYLNKTNMEGYPAADRSDREQYLQTLLCNTMGNTFYATGAEMTQMAAGMHQKMIRNDPMFAAKAIVYARNNGMMRSQPLYGLAVLSTYEPGLFEQVFDKVVQIPNDLKDFMCTLAGPAEDFGLARGEGGRVVKRCASAYLNNMSQYHVVKYGGEAGGYTLRDIIMTMHPKPKDELQGLLFRYITKGAAAEKMKVGSWTMKRAVEGGETAVTSGTGGTLIVPMDLSSLPQVAAVERLKRASAAEAPSIVREFKLPHEVVTGACQNMTADVWDALVQDMPLKATLRALNSLARVKFANGETVLDHNRDLIEARFSDPAAITKAKILPLELLKAYKAVSTPWVRDVLRLAIERSMENIPDIPGTTAILLDRSGSMGAPLINDLKKWEEKNGHKQLVLVESLDEPGIARLDKDRYAVFTRYDKRSFVAAMVTTSLYKKTGRCVAYGFGDDSHVLNLSRVDSALTQADHIPELNAATNPAAPLEDMIRSGKRVDNIVLITDGQQNRGRPFYEVLSDYRRMVNPNAKCFIVDISGYLTGLVPVNDPQSYYIYGWNNDVLSYISLMASGEVKSMVDDIDKMVL
jgi:60 kDa SS-A/Ro ribonucleoprotein